VCLFADPREMQGVAGASLARYLETGSKILAIEDEAAWESAWHSVADLKSSLTRFWALACAARPQD